MATEAKIMNKNQSRSQICKTEVLSISNSPQLPTNELTRRRQHIPEFHMGPVFDNGQMHLQLR